MRDNIKRHFERGVQCIRHKHIGARARRNHPAAPHDYDIISHISGGAELVEDDGDTFSVRRCRAQKRQHIAGVRRIEVCERFIGKDPRRITRKHPRYGTPWIAILISAAIYASLALHTLGQLISIYVWLRAATTVLTVLSAWALRRKRPDLPRAFRIPGGRLGLAYVVALPIVMTCVVIYTLRYSDPISLRWGPWALATGPVVNFVVKWFAKRAALRNANAR